MNLEPQAPEVPEAVRLSWTSGSSRGLPPLVRAGALLVAHEGEAVSPGCPLGPVVGPCQLPPADVVRLLGHGLDGVEAVADGPAPCHVRDGHRLADLERLAGERLRDAGLRMEFDEDRKAFVFDLGLGGEIGMMGIVIGVQNDCVNCPATFPFRGSDKTSHMLAEFVCRVNSHLSVGHLDYDFDDGEVRFAYDMTEGQLKAEKGDALERFLGCLYAIGKKFGPSIAQLSLGLGDPETLYKAAQFRTSEEKNEKPKGTASEETSPEDASVQHMKRCYEKATESKEPVKAQKKACDDVEDQIPVPVHIP